MDDKVLYQVLEYKVHSILTDVVVVVVPKKRRTSMASDAASRIRVALDLSFNKLMTEKVC